MHLLYVLGIPFLACLEMIAILGYLGIHVLKREVIFIDIALAQIAAVGAIGAHLAFEAHGHSALGYTCALGSTLIAAIFYSLVRKRVVEIPLEAVIGVSYAIAAAGALFLVGIAPGGHIHIQQMLAGSILWATWGDVLWGAMLFAVVGLCFYIFRKPFASISEGYEKAVKEGINTLGWDFLFYALLGVVITFAVRLAGVVIVFTFLIIPATLSALFASSWRERLIIAWITGGIAAALGLLFAGRFDFSVGPAIALFLGIPLVLTGLLRYFRATKILTAVVSLIAAACVFICFLFLPGSPNHTPMTVPASTHDPPLVTVTHAQEFEQLLDIDVEQIGRIKDIEKLELLFKKATDAEELSAIVCRLLKLDPHSGTRLAFIFLKKDPPLLFRQTVVEELEIATGEVMEFDINKPFKSVENQKAIARIVEKYGLELQTEHQ